MKIKVSEYIAEFLAANGIRHVFTVVGGGAMHLNDSLGHHHGLKCIYSHHEQASAIAAESYARINNDLAALCVTTGPGGTNAITGVVGAWLDSIPMLVISGQVRYDTTARSTGLDLRAMGDQEFDIVKAVSCMTKYADMITDPQNIRYALEKAIYLAKAGRPGPCWLDIPLNVQGAYVDSNTLAGFEPPEAEKPDLSVEAGFIIERIKGSARPVFYAGNGIRIAGAHKAFIRVAKKLNIPIVTTWNGIDAVETDNTLYTGRGGIFGDRAGNFTVQNSDLILSIGNRLSIRQVGYSHASWAREAFVIAVDVDPNELQKPLVRLDHTVCADALDLLTAMDAALPDKPLFTENGWLTRCSAWKRDYPVVLPKHYEDKTANVYCFINELSRRLPDGSITVVGNGSACVVGSHAYVIGKDSRFIINSAIASMGYDLPAAIGACVASGGKETICITGDGSIQMNIQELQTIIHHRFPIKVFVINNGGYHSIRQTQKNFFGEPLVGVGYDSGDLSFPDMQKLAAAYGFPYYSCRSNNDFSVLDELLALNSPLICEIFVSREQLFEPKSATKRLSNGTLVSAPLENLAPFLSDEELRKNMIIPLWED